MMPAVPKPQEGEMKELREQIRAGYAEAARNVDTKGGCCEVGASDGAENFAACTEEADRFGSSLYGADTEALPDKAVAASLGCGNPTAVADLYPGEVVLDLGSGGGIDALLAAGRVGPTGKVIGMDMTDEMLALARANQADAGVDNIEFIKGYVEDVPLPSETVDVIISNCVINLSVDKPTVFAEMFRVLQPGGRLGISDVVAQDELGSEQRAELGTDIGCVAGAMSFAEYQAGLEAVGFTDISVTPTHQVTDGMHAAIVKATKPADG